MRLKRETQGAFCVLNANAKSQTRKSMKINVICTVSREQLFKYIMTITITSRFTPGRFTPNLSGRFTPKFLYNIFVRYF